jgi:hypothetical protein
MGTATNPEARTTFQQISNSSQLFRSGSMDAVLFCLVGARAKNAKPNIDCVASLDVSPFCCSEEV